MIGIRSMGPALVLLATSACVVDPPSEVQVQPDRGPASIPATRLIPPASPVPAVHSEASPRSERELRVEAAAREHGEAMNAYYDLFRSAKTDEERLKVAETASEPDDAPFQERMRAVVREDPSDRAAFDALRWLLRNSRNDDVAADVDILATRHFERAEMAEVLMSLQYATAPSATALLDRLAQESPHRNVRGGALLAQAEASREEARMVAAVRAEREEQDRAQLVEFLGADEFARLGQLDAAETETRALELYERVVRDYADVPSSRAGTVGDAARATLHEMRNLVVGKVAPDITGEDIQGAVFKLSDYRGQVVMLDFWGHW
ncbi:MAG: peroxiredoxin family protein [Planctomycetota bacterium]